MTEKVKVAVGILASPAAPRFRRGFPAIRVRMEIETVLVERAFPPALGKILAGLFTGNKKEKNIHLISYMI